MFGNPGIVPFSNKGTVGPVNGRSAHIKGNQKSPRNAEAVGGRGDRFIEGEVSLFCLFAFLFLFSFSLVSEAKGLFGFH